MSDEQSRETAGALTDLQRSRIDFARRDLDYARSEDLAQLPTAGHILMIERLRNRLDDMLALLDEVTSPPKN
ncbi:hypothetical protein ACH5A2_19965 [Streptomyces collinus]|uniref:hypothetical protein n=1 Tax=Streptomyces collinus TaxID=42684 RepID=UPI0037A68104